MVDGTRSTQVRDYLDRVVNRHDVEAVGELVSADYRGSGFGWPADRDALSAFYRDQAATRPTWRIDVQSTLEVGDAVAVRAFAGPAAPDPTMPDVEWLAAYRFAGELVAEVQVLELRERHA
jgi:predicted SnoaL-like aldol condensation-catalyzing enzyme